MDYLGLIALFAGIFGLTGYAGLLLRQAIGLYRQRPDLRRTLRPVLLNLIEPFVSLLYLIPCIIWWDYGYLLSLVGSDFAAGSIVFAYHWPMQLLLVYAPFGWMFVCSPKDGGANGLAVLCDWGRARDHALALF